MNFEDTIAHYIEQHRLLCHDALYLVALSGGADSVCLLLVLLKLGYKVEAAHCNFHLRGEESQRDEDFVVSLCQQQGVALHRAHFDTRTYANVHHVSIEMAARELRYRYFEQLRHDVGAEAVCVAHHQDDSVETILLNLVRGTGLRGLTGIKPRQGHILRPLLCVSRNDIEAWLADRQQNYVTDSTNLVADVMRNQLRLKVIPQLQQVTAAASQGVLRSAHYLEEAQKVYMEAIRQSLDECKTDSNRLSIQKLLQQPSPESVLFEWLSPVGFTPAQIETIADRLSQAAAGREWLSATHVVVVHQGALVLAGRQAVRPTLRIPEPGNYLYEDRKLRVTIAADVTISREAAVATLDADKVAFPLTLRPVEKGDRFHPFGMKGSKLVSDYMTDRKLSPIDKQRQLAICDQGGRIIWLVGLRTDDRCRIDNKTKKTITITFTNQ